MKILAEALLKFIAGIVLVGLLVFLPAGSVCYMEGWLLMGVLFIPMLAGGVVLLLKRPALLKKRLNGKEKLREQGVVVKLSGLMFVVGFVVAGLDHRYGWLPLPRWISLVAAAIFLLAYGLYAEVLRENVYLSRTIEVQEGQTVLDTGLYVIVRHPMYAATILLFWSIPFILGSLWSFLIFSSYPVIIVVRIKSEEKLLEKDLSGYAAYKERVPYRLVPFIW
ncbi:MAG: isoprenylcysteine carboxylmethyltransferase family protein [Ruminococcaceae bacterium]|nr:isoprenylcysteine carboxylmethyltransferase family protein [Oscillospiraceae bacterium]